MATFERLEKVLEDAKNEYQKAERKLKEGKYQGEKLIELEEELMVKEFNETERKRREDRRKRLYEEKNRLEENKED
ncbi:9388_t:CDS:1, partial [Funneliformis geosporum]